MKKISFPISGMHCASCARNIERKLGKVTGVTKASVNYAAEKAYVECENDVPDKNLSDAVSSLGYTAHLHKEENAGDKSKKKELANLKTKVIISGILSILIFFISHILSQIPIIGQFFQWFDQFLKESLTQGTYPRS